MKIRQCMTRDPEVAGPNDSAREVLRRMRTQRIRHLPVVEASGVLVGMISERDLLPLETPLGAPQQVPGRAFGRPFDDADAAAFDDPCVRDLMTAEVKTVEAEDTLHVAVRLFLEHRFGALPVVAPGDAQTLVGIVSPIDVLQAWHDLSTRALRRNSDKPE